MFIKPKVKSDLQKAYDRALLELSAHDPVSEEYGEILDRVVNLHTMKEKSFRPSADSVLLAITNILGIAMITRYERANVVTSKAISFIPKPR